MTEFRERPLRGAETLGERFRQLREEQRLTVTEAASRAKVGIKHLIALEEGRYRDLPGLVYARNFVRSYARILQVREAAAMELFEREYAVAMRLVPAKVSTPPEAHQPWPILTPRGIRRAVIVVLALGVLIYLGSEIRNLTSAPRLIILAPADQLVTTERSVTLRGTTDPETVVTANGKLVTVERSGSFQEALDLQGGLNTIVIRAQKKRGRSTTVTRSILVQPTSGGTKEP